MGTAGRQLAESSRAGERPRGSFCRPTSYVMVVQPKDSARPSVAPCMARVPAAAQQCRLGPDRSGRGRPAEAACSRESKLTKCSPGLLVNPSRQVVSKADQLSSAVSQLGC